MRITVVGTGYVGLVSGTCFAETGNHVVCVDIDANKVQRMQNGEVPIYEPGLEVLFERNTKQGRLTFTTDLAEVSNPEFLREGVAVDDFLKPERVVIGTSSDKAKKVMERLYNPFVRQGNPVIFMDEKSAEMTKYAANSFLATKITFMNEVANLCEQVGANVDMVRKGIGSDSRIGKRFLFPGVGYGGSCFPKDVQALAKTAEENNYDFKILQSVMEVNKKQKSILSGRIKKYFGESIANKTIGIWGLSFKPNTDDIREAPALIIINELLAAGAKVKAFDPEAMGNVKSLKEPVVFDGRNVYDPEDMKQRGFIYNSIGRP